MNLQPAPELKMVHIHHYLIAMEGVLVRSDEMIPGADRLVERLQKRKAKFLLLTNDSRHSPSELAYTLQGLGLPIQAKDIFTSSLATARYLKTQKADGSAYVIGEDGLFSALREVGYVLTDQNPDYVVLGGTDRYDIGQITRAINLIKSGASFICTNPEPVGESRRGLIPASGAMAALIQKANGVAPFFIGKPNPLMTRYALNYLGVHSEDTILIGDRMDTDIIAGLESGIKTILVLSGDTQLEDIAHYAYLPNHILRSVADLYP